MKRPLPAHLSYTSALALLPATPLASQIDTIRRAHDRQFQRWPPHINLLYPFLASPTQDPFLQDRLRRAVSTVAPFLVSLTPVPKVFRHGRRGCTVWLEPVVGDSSSSDALLTLRAALRGEFAECDADDRPFVPHLSVGQAGTGQGEAERLQAVVEALMRDLLPSGEAEVVGEADGQEREVEGAEQASTRALNWLVDRVCVIERAGFRGRFHVTAEAKLGG